MRLHRFKPASNKKKIGFTIDPSGANLPEKFAPWVSAGTVNIRAGDGPKVGDNANAILAGVERDGFFIFPSS
jgi:hypothetical protein